MRRERPDEDPMSPDLYCYEDPRFLYEDDEEVAEENVVVNQNEIELEEAHLHRLIDKEITFGFKKDEDLVIDNWVQEARWQAITWVLTENKRDAFVRLISVTCLCLAAKMEEMNRPPLSQYDSQLEGKKIQKMELVVLAVLEWRMDLITPFAFLDNFIAKLCQESPPGVNPGLKDSSFPR